MLCLSSRTRQGLAEQRASEPACKNPNCTEMTFREITTKEISALFDVRISVRENAYTLEGLYEAGWHAPASPKTPELLKFPAVAGGLQLGRRDRLPAPQITMLRA